MPSSPPLSSEPPAHYLRRQQGPLRVAVIGAGPVGLEAALYAQRLGCSVRVFEREEFVGPDVCAWGHVSMFTPWAANRTPLGVLALHEAARQAHRSPPIFPPDAVHPTGGEFLARYLHPLAHLLGDSLRLQTRVVGVGRSYLFADEHADAPEKRAVRRFRLLTRSPLEERMFTADFVLDASGVSHTHAWLGAGGLPALGEMGSVREIFYGLPDIGGRDRIHFLGKRTLLLGGGASAATSALALADLCEKDPPGSFVWAAKSRADLPLPLVPGDPLPRRDLLFKKANLLAAQGHPRMEYLGTTQTDAVAHSLGTGQFEVSLQVNHVTRREKFDAVIANVGARAGSETFERVLHPNEPGFWAIGAKAKTGEDFLLQSARAPIRDIFRKIMDDPNLDLYAQAEAHLVDG